jgi:hypothetical protein
MVTASFGDASDPMAQSETEAPSTAPNASTRPNFKVFTEE